jgi:hypothetical protein
VKGRLQADEDSSAAGLGTRQRANTVSYTLLAEVNTFHEQRVRDVKSSHQVFLQEQIKFYQKVTLAFTTSTSTIHSSIFFLPNIFIFLHLFSSPSPTIPPSPPLISPPYPPPSLHHLLIRIVSDN